MSIPYDYYRIFYYVAKYKNFTQAANVLMNNQPNISRAISNLEHDLGCRLFVRSNRGVTLTPEGEKLYARVIIAHRQLQAAEQELSDASSLQKGIVSVSVSETAMHGFLLPRLHEFYRKYPGIHLRLSSGTTPQALSSLKSGLVDFAVVTTPTNVTKPLREIPLMKIREILVGGPRFRELAKRTLKISELKNYPLILLNSQTNTRAFFNRFFMEHHLSIVPDIEASTTDQVLPLIRSDFCIGFLPDVFAREFLERGELFEIPLECEAPSRSICLVKDMDRPGSIAARELEKLLYKMPPETVQ